MRNSIRGVRKNYHDGVKNNRVSPYIQKVGSPPLWLCLDLRLNLISNFFHQVLQHEMRAIQQACRKLEQGYEPAITFIVVQKRHHARFFAKNREDQVNTAFWIFFHY